MNDLTKNLFYEVEPGTAKEILGMANQSITNAQERQGYIDNAFWNHDEMSEFALEHLTGEMRRVLRNKNGMRYIVAEYEAICWHMVNRLGWENYPAFANHYPKMNSQTRVRTIGLYMDIVNRSGSFWQSTESRGHYEIVCDRWAWNGEIKAVAGFDETDNILYFQLI